MKIGRVDLVLPEYRSTDIIKKSIMLSDHNIIATTHKKEILDWLFSTNIFTVLLFDVHTNTNAFTKERSENLINLIKNSPIIYKNKYDDNLNEHWIKSIQKRNNFL